MAYNIKLNQRRSQYKKRSFRPDKRMPLLRIARRRPFTYDFRVYRHGGVTSRHGLDKPGSRVNKRRRNLLLPPVNLKITRTNETPDANQWSQFLSTAWSARFEKQIIAQGGGDMERLGETVTFRSFYQKVHLYQATGNQYQYRFMLVKFFKEFKQLSTITPAMLLWHSNTSQQAIYSRYKTNEEQGDLQFKVLRDMKFTWSTQSPRVTYKTVSIKYPLCNVSYEKGVDAGTHYRNGVVLFVITTAIHTSANFSFGQQCSMTWVG